MTSPEIARVVAYSFIKASLFTTLWKAELTVIQHAQRHKKNGGLQREETRILGASELRIPGMNLKNKIPDQSEHCPYSLGIEERVETETVFPWEGKAAENVLSFPEILRYS